MHPLRGGLRFAENTSLRPRLPPRDCAPPPPSRGGQCDFEIWISAGDGQNLCLQHSEGGERRVEGKERGKSFRGVFSYFYPPPLASFFSVVFFSRSRCKFLRLRFLLLLFFFFFPRWSLRKKGILGEISVLVSLLSLLIVCGCCIVWFKWWWLFLSFFFGGIFI